MTPFERIKAEIEGHPIVLYMKGTPSMPMCGFSARVVQALHQCGVDDIHSINVLEDPEIRANLPRFSNWPTFPQLFVRGELLGGCDIVGELWQSGELVRILEDAKTA